MQLRHHRCVLRGFLQRCGHSSTQTHRALRTCGLTCYPIPRIARKRPLPSHLVHDCVEAMRYSVQKWHDERRGIRVALWGPKKGAHSLPPANQPRPSEHTVCSVRVLKIKVLTTAHSPSMRISMITDLISMNIAVRGSHTMELSRRRFAPGVRAVRAVTLLA